MSAAVKLRASTAFYGFLSLLIELQVMIMESIINMDLQPYLPKDVLMRPPFLLNMIIHRRQQPLGIIGQRQGITSISHCSTLSW